MTRFSRAHLSDRALLLQLAAHVRDESRATAELLADLAEVDSRKLYLPAAYPSMYAYCVGEPKLSEDAAYKRIHAARAARSFPAILEAVAEGRLHLSAVVLLAPHLTRDIAGALIAAAGHRTKAAIETLLAGPFPRPDVPTQVQVVPPTQPSLQLAAGGTNPQRAPEPVRAPESQPLAPITSLAAVARSRPLPLSPQRFALQLTIGQEAYDDLLAVQALLGSAVPAGDIGAVIGQALKLLRRDLERRRCAATERPRPATRRGSTDPRRTPAAVRREVWRSDGGRCTFVGEADHRCESRTRLELDHVRPVARGGLATSDTLRLRCRAHNQHAAERTFGAGFMDAKRREAVAARAALRARREALERERAAAAAEWAPGADVIPWLRQLGFRADEARRGAAACSGLADAPLEDRVRHALRTLARRGPRRMDPPDRLLAAAVLTPLHP